MTTEVEQLIQRILYGPEPLTFTEMTSTYGFIVLMLIIWSPVIISIISIIVFRIVKKRRILRLNNKSYNV